ncbi:hypothetical protein MN032_11060 [Agromyces atrinae]|uniref:hypothetical protein n=1 Tax=Agromyces atrinae TaxID=592376 RepID=UPI001F577FD6|nr:hypothetical protein [Agromyces atrinae]MCI2958237.1 hypothetical protein [Agromyces atrinae]
MSAADITLRAVTAVIAEHKLEQVSEEGVWNDIAWALGGQIDYQQGLEAIVAAAIKIDRAERDLIEVVAEVLDDRGATDAAALVRDTDPADDLWNNYVGPMLDSLEEDYTAIAQGGDE